MTAAARGPDLSFLNEQEARAIFQVLQRDSELRRAEKHRVSKLLKRKTSETGLQGVTGEWFEEIQRKKFENNTDVNRMLKQPLEHQLRKSKTSELHFSTQKNTSASFLGFRSPFAWLFSFRKSRKHQTQKQPRQKVIKENQTKYVFFSCAVLGDLDDQLAQEQAQDPLDKTISINTATNVQYKTAFPSSERQTTVRGQHRNDWSDIRLSSVSFGQSSEGSLYPPSITQNSGFRHKHYMNRDTAGRSYSVCSLRRCPSSVSSDQLSASSLQCPLARESNNGFIPRFGRQNPKRIPLSSIVWNNTPDSPAQTSAQEKVFRTQSLMEFHATDHGKYPSPLQESRKYACHHSKHHYRRSFSSSNCFSRVSCPDKAASPLSFDNWENYPLYNSENNLSRSCYRDTSSHGKLYTNQKNSPYGKKDGYPSWADIPQYHSDKVFISPDASFEVVMTNLNDQQWTHTKNAKYASQRLQNDFHLYSPENTSIKKIMRNVSNRTFSEFTESCQPWLSCNCPVSSSGTRSDEPVCPDSKDQTKPIGLNSNSVIVSQRSTKMDFEQLNNVENKLPDEVTTKDMTLLSVSQQADTNYTNTQSFPSYNSASAILPNSASLFNSLRSKRRPQVTARRETAKIYTSNSNRRNVRMKENDCPPNSVVSQPPCILPADESRKESFLPSQKPWEHNLHYATKRKSIKVDNQSTETVNQATPQGQSSLVDVEFAPSTEKLVNHQGMLSSPPEYSSSSQSSPQTLSHKDNLKCLETLTNSSVNCTVTEFQAEGGKTAQVSRTDVTEKTSQKRSQNPSTLVTKDCNRRFTTSSSQNGSSGNFYTHSFGDPKTSEHSLNYFCLEKEKGKIRNNSPCIERLNKQDSLLRYTSSCSITGSPSRNNPKSPDPHVIYYTLPRKSASIAGSIMSDTPISFPRESRTSRYDRLRTETPNRTDAFCSNQRCMSCLDSKHSLLTSAPLNAATSIQEKDYPIPFIKSPNDSAGLTDSCNDLTGRGYSGFSDCKERGNCLHKYKTTSTFTVCVDEDHVKYHELVSIYYTLPRRHSRTFCNLFRDNPEDAELPLPKENSHLANVFFPNTLEKEVPSYSSDQVPSALITPQNLETAVDSKDENSHLPPSSEKVCASKAVSTVHTRKDTSPVLSLAESRPLEDLCYSTSDKNSVQKGNSENCCQPTKVNTNKNQNSLLPHTRERSSLGRSSNSNVPVPPAEDRYRYNMEVKQRENLLHQITPLYSNKCSGLQLRTNNSRTSTNDLISCNKMLSESQNKAFEVGTASSADPLLQLHKMGSTDTDELKNSKIIKEQNLQNTEMSKDCTGVQESERHSEDSLNINCKDKILGVTQDQKLPQNAENESKLLSGCTRDKVKDIEKRKNRPSIKNKLAAVYKTSRKFSSKNLPPKPHISNIFSQNDGSATSLEVNTPLDSLLSGDSSQSFLQSANENQTHSLDTEGNTPIQRAAERNKSENENDLSLLANNTNWRSFTSSYTQKEAISPQKNTTKVENRPSLTTLFPDKTATRNKNSQTLCLGLENRSQPFSPRATTPDPLGDEKRRASSSACSPPLPLLTDRNSNLFINNYLQADICPKQSLTSQMAFGQHQNTYQSNSLKNANLHSDQLRKSHTKNQRERHLSESAYTQESHDSFAFGSNILPKDSRHGKRFKSYSELLSCDENENWASDDIRSYSTRNLMYPSVEFGIFGKEQQLAFLENIKRSLTEGRLWRPCLLNNPGALRDGESPSLSRSELLSSSSTGSKISSAASSPRELTKIYQGEPATYSDSDSDTTTDDEYYLDEIDKESEL
uniref:Exophilin 5 n=1 Tax=Apteryx owenii TaxID=8824 RepID=A0A8B9PAF0_APTOW